MTKRNTDKMNSFVANIAKIHPKMKYKDIDFSRDPEKESKEQFSKLVESTNKKNTNLKKDMEENPAKYLKKAMIELNNIKKLLAKKTIELRNFEGNCIRAVAGLQKELEDKDGEIETLKGVVSRINFITDGFVDRNEKN